MNPSWNAFVREDCAVEPEGGNGGGGALKGRAFAVKDVFALRGVANSAGNPDWLRTHGPAEATAPAVLRLLRQGARLRGLTHTDELMFSLNGENYHYGTPVNPKAPDRIPGGSSSGSAVAVSAGLSDFALGTDTGGSVRIPSAYCGIYGIRPTFGAVPMEGVIPLAPSFDTAGWMARDPRLLLEAGSVLLQQPEQPPSPASPAFARAYLPKDVWELADGAVREELDRHVPEWLHSIGRLDAVTLAPEGLHVWFQTFRTMQGYEIWQTHGAWIEREQPRFGPGIADRFAWTRTLTREEYGKQRMKREEIRSRLEQLLGEDGVLLIPTAPCGAPKRKQSGAAMDLIRTRMLQMTCPAGLGGLPQLTMPAGTVNGLPVGLSLIGGRGQDMRLLRAAAAWSATAEPGYASREG